MDLIDMPLAAPRALRAAVVFLERLPEIEPAVATAGSNVQRVLDEVLEHVRPVKGELIELRETAQRLEVELTRSREALAPVSDQIDELQRTIAQLEGSLEHVFDRVPGLSAEKAQERGREVAARS